MMKNTSTSSLEYNIKAHNKIARKYESIHGEIYNEVEQSRLLESLSDAKSLVTTGSKEILALDFGCGAGNLTQKLTELGCSVLACDISDGFLDLIASRKYRMPVETKHLNGVDLDGIEDSSVDMVVMYSVLHHVPDYISLMKEFIRVLKKGGVLYIDHEASENVWENSEEFQLFQKEIKKTSRIDFRKYFMITNYVDYCIRKFSNPKYQREGDIHVFVDDHIKWSDIKLAIKIAGATIVKESDYLLYRRVYDKSIFESWGKRIHDTHLLVAKKQ